MGFVELVAFLAITMALNALAIDVIIPALPRIGGDLAVADDNQRQLVIVVYLIGMGASQLVHGPLADRIGRRTTLLVGLGLYSAAALAGALAPSFTVLLIARVGQGLGAGAPRVVAMSIARDRYRGTEMARVMSLVMMVFMVVPIMAPSVGQLILLVAPWRAIFGVLTAAAVAVGVWTFVRLEESLDPAHRRALSPATIARGFVEVARTRATLIPMIAMTCTSGALMGFVTSAQQIFQDTFGVGRAFTLLFALIAVTMSAGSFANARLVQVLGPARLARRALHVQIAAAAALVALALTDHLALPVFVALQALVMMGFGFVGSNLNALAMEPMGHLAGTASSAIGAITTIGSALLGGALGHAYDGTARPLVVGTLVLGVAARLILLLAPASRAGAHRPGASTTS
jgi:DHA1 family bicyclomycin/chloramphenicol resistance-like MFS transporter